MGGFEGSSPPPPPDLAIVAESAAIPPESHSGEVMNETGQIGGADETPTRSIGFSKLALTLLTGVAKSDTSPAPSQHASLSGSEAVTEGVVKDQSLPQPHITLNNETEDDPLKAISNIQVPSATEDMHKELKPADPAETIIVTEATAKGIVEWKDGGSVAAAESMTKETRSTSNAADDDADMTEPSNETSKNASDAAAPSADTMEEDSAAAPPVAPPAPPPPPPPQPSSNSKKRHRSKKASGAAAAFTAGRWTASEHQAFLAGLATYGREWKRVAMHIPTRTSSQVRSHAQKYFFKLQQADRSMTTTCSGSDNNMMGASDPAYSLHQQQLPHQSPPYQIHHYHQHQQPQPTDQEQNPHHHHRGGSIPQQLLSPSVRANVERILAQPETVQAEVDDTLRRLRERYVLLQQRLRRQNRPSAAAGGDFGAGGGGSVHDSSMEGDSLQDSELIALHVLQGGLEQSASSTSTSSEMSAAASPEASSIAAAAAATAAEGGDNEEGNDKAMDGTDSSQNHREDHDDRKNPRNDEDGAHDDDGDEEDDGNRHRNPQAPPTKRSKSDHPTLANGENHANNSNN